MRSECTAYICKGTGVHQLMCKSFTSLCRCRALLFACRFAADSMLSVAIYEMVGILPTDPGYGYYRDHVQMFDPGWKGYQAKGPEDWNFDVFDKGNDPEGVLQRYTLACLLTFLCSATCMVTSSRSLTRSRWFVQVVKELAFSLSSAWCLCKLAFVWPWCLAFGCIWIKHYAHESQCLSGCDAFRHCSHVAGLVF